MMVSPRSDRAANTVAGAHDLVGVRDGSRHNSASGNLKISAIEVHGNRRLPRVGKGDAGFPHRGNGQRCGAQKRVGAPHPACVRHLIISHALANSRNNGFAGFHHDGNITATELIQGEISTPALRLAEAGWSCLLRRTLSIRTDTEASRVRGE
jgi:hypothetical protein